MTGLALDLSKRAFVEGLLIEQSAGGLLIGPDGIQSGSSGIAITANAGLALNAPLQSVLDLPADTLIQSNGQNHILMPDGAVVRSGTIRNFGVNYVIPATNATFVIQSAASLTVESGVHLQSQDLIEVRGGAEVHFAGTEEEPIIFTSPNGQPAGHGGILLEADASLNSTFQYVHFIGAGLSGYGALNVEITAPFPSEQVTNCIFEACTYGISLATDNSIDHTSGNSFISILPPELGVHPTPSCRRSARVNAGQLSPTRAEVVRRDARCGQKRSHERSVGLSAGIHHLTLLEEASRIAGDDDGDGVGGVARPNRDRVG